MAAIFDMDGVLVDTGANHRAAWEALLEELGYCLLDDWSHSTSAERDRLLLAQAKHTAGHRKYGDAFEAYRRFAEAFGVAA